ncbi:MAG: hypothetical protein DRR16_04010 [Candidatus Parabeggiatoa sp. nov. 3]|jgi:hypothetical protein|nr:MAG: hypothetical protein DRR00_24425 [Gammaproteobacteria bacterium]RKZ56787.1 MAG: hypothetical protein DRQ99_27945 [Gammaproteobacteria bacterium]RKZ88812.1 MAG: hypothetical protein DRR16_04010 [Gammaproteobacteria bacterium]
MIKAIISISAMLMTLNTWGIEENYLEGISILGKEKIAYFSIEGNDISVHEGEEIILNENEAQGIWQIVRIEASGVLLKTKAGITKQFRLDSRVHQKTEKTADESQQAEEEVETHGSASLQPKSRTVQTPFGHFTIREEMPFSHSPPLSEKPTLAEEDVPPDHHIVRTPFGDFIVKDKE